MDDDLKVSVTHGKGIPVHSGSELSVEAPPTPVVVAVEQKVTSASEATTYIAAPKSRGSLGECPKSEALEQLQEIGIRGSGMVLLRSMVLDLESRYNKTETALQISQEKLQSERLSNAVLTAKLEAERRMKVLQNVFFTAGGLLNAVAVKLIFDNQQPVGLTLLAVGIALIFAGWLWPKGANR